MSFVFSGFTESRDCRVRAYLLSVMYRPYHEVTDHQTRLSNLQCQTFLQNGGHERRVQTATVKPCYAVQSQMRRFLHTRRTSGPHGCVSLCTDGV